MKQRGMKRETLQMKRRRKERGKERLVWTEGALVSEEHSEVKWRKRGVVKSTEDFK